MKASEAIETLIGIRLVSGYSKSREKALDMAIAALEKQEGEGGLTMAEYIEREAALSAVDCGNLHKGIVDALQENIKDIPAADVQPVRHGRWISDSPGKRFGTVVRLDKDGCPVGSCHCSECGEWLTASDEYPVIGYYCPNCGAKMDGGVNDGGN